MKPKGIKLMTAMSLVALACSSHSAMAITLTSGDDIIRGDGTWSESSRTIGKELRINPGMERLEVGEVRLKPSEREIRYCDHHATLDEFLPVANDKDGHIEPPLNSGETVFEHVSLFDHKESFTESFRIEEEGTYQVILTDFEFPKPLKMAGINITTATESLGTLMETGYFTFDADPGKYFVSFFGKAHHLGQYGIEISMVGTSAVPVPGAAWLFGSGLLGAVGVIRRKTVQQQAT